MNYIIGVDGGGTKTEAVAYSVKGEILSQCVTGFGNMVMDSEQALNNITEAIDGCIESLDKEKLCGIYLGLAGIEVNNNRNIAEEFFMKKYGVRLSVFNDGELAKIAVLKGEDGILTIGGTGAICLGTNEEKKITCGGWGHLLGDEGSGYRVSMDALKNVAYEEDQGLKKSISTEYILKHLKIQNRKEIKNFVYTSTKNEIASLTPVVVKAAKDGDKKAVEILKNNGRELAILTETVCRRLGLKGKVNIAIKGSVLTKAKLVRTEFENYLNENIEDINIICEEVSSTIGGYYAYINHIKNLEG